jgi:phenylalanyl-tRNA synthetase alpha chain
MDTEIQQIKNLFLGTIESIQSKQALDELYLKYFSKTKGIVTALMRELPNLPPEDKRKYGPRINALQKDLKEAISQKETKLEKARIQDPAIDLTYLEKPLKTGMLHPTIQVIREMNEFFRYHGFSVADGPEIETAEYNFRKLNLPEGHPATDLQDTLFIEEPNLMLRTHTSSVETRVLTDYKPPIRVAFPGKCYRNETVTTNNGAFFNQYQGVVVDKGITMQHLKSTLLDFHKFIFGDDVVIRFRYKYYPEVSPGMGTDMLCKFCGGEGCAVCKQMGWIEVLGSGMIHYNTLKMCGIDPEVYTGFAFGMGLDRLVMQKFNIPDIRMLYGGGMVYE